MTAPDPTSIDRLTVRAGLGRVRELIPLAGGSNNRVFRADCEDGRATLKYYFRSPADPRDRLGAEFAFCRYVRAAGVMAVPAPLAADGPAGLGLFEFVEGERPQAATGPLIARAAEFIRSINAPQHRSLATGLPLASEACFTVEEHLGVVGGRANRLGDITPESAIDRDALQFVHRELMPNWMAIRDATRAVAGREPRASRRSLGPDSRIISPSDFGFHNSLVGRDGRVTFLDFEYAGWDDPAKLVCDFFCQPAVPVPLHHFDEFSKSALADLPDAARILERARLLLPVYGVKWVCIRLNEFLPGGEARRSFANPNQLEIRKAQQLAAAREALVSLTRFERACA